MHIFLTGDIQIGKTTVINKTIDLLNKNIGGFQTYFGPDRGLPTRRLYINSAAESKILCEENIVAQFMGNEFPIVHNEKFDTYGVKLIQDAREKSDLIIMDECGNLEQFATLFQRKILDTLNGNIPILGVVKQNSWGWTDYIRNHAKAKFITVTKKNRNQLPEMIANYIEELDECVKICYKD